MTVHLHLKRISKPKHTRLKFDPRKAARSQSVRNLPTYNRRNVCISHHHEELRWRHGFDHHHLQHNSDWNSYWHPWQTPSENKQTEQKTKTLGHCRHSWSVRQKERSEKEEVRTWKIWEIQGSEQWQHQAVHEKGKRRKVYMNILERKKVC